MRASAFPVSNVRKMPRSESVWRVVLPIMAVIVAADVATKWWAVNTLTVYGPSINVIGETFRFSLVYNRGAAFGLSLGPYSRWLFIALTAVAMFILWRLLRQTAANHYTKLIAIALVAAGAIGNLIDRVRSELGVVDFIDIGIPTWRWPTFNVADMAVSCGAFLLAGVLWVEENRAEAAAKAARAASADNSSQ